MTIDFDNYSTYELNMFATALRRDFINNPENANAKKLAQIIYDALSEYLQQRGLTKTYE